MADIFLWPMALNALRHGLELSQWPKINSVKTHLDEWEEFKEAMGEGNDHDLNPLA